MTLDIRLEKFYDIPVPEDGIAFGSISANNITALLQVNNTIFGGSLVYPTITITLKGINVPPLSSPTAFNVGSTTFPFRDKTWHLLATSEGSKLKIANNAEMYLTWSCTGVDLSDPRISV